MDKMISKEIDFVINPTYKKVSKSISNITKELINIIGKQYSNIINERISKTNFVFFNKITDLEIYCKDNLENINKSKDKKIDENYQTIVKNINSYNNKVEKLRKKLSLEFILEIVDELSGDDKEYIKNHKKIDLTKLSCYKVFFENKETENLINGLFAFWNDEYEEKLKDKKTSISDLESIFNNREKSLKLLGLKNVNVRTFDRKNIIYIFDKINDYNLKFKKEVEIDSINKNKIIKEFLLSEENLNDTKNIPIYFKEIYKKNKTEINKINDKIINTILKINEPTIVWAADNYSDESNMRFLLFSPSMNYKNNDFEFVRQICRLAFNSENFNTKSVVEDNSIIGKDEYLMFSNTIIDYIAYQITKRLYETKDIIINGEKNKNIIDFNDGLFLVEKFYLNYSQSIIESLITNNNKFIFDEIGKSNFDNFVNIINRYYYDHHGNLLPIKERKKEVFITTIKNILNISLQNMEQYKKILINKEKYEK